MAIPPPNYDEMRAFYPVSGAMELSAELRYIYGPAHAVKGLSNGQTRFGTDAVIYPASW